MRAGVAASVPYTTARPPLQKRFGIQWMLSSSDGRSRGGSKQCEPGMCQAVARRPAAEEWLRPPWPLRSLKKTSFSYDYSKGSSEKPAGRPIPRRRRRRRRRRRPPQPPTHSVGGEISERKI